MRDELHAEDLLRGFLSFVRILDDLDAAAFAASARMNLRFDDDGFPAERDRSVPGFFRREDDAAFRERDGVLSEDLLALVFVNLHRPRV